MIHLSRSTLAALLVAALTLSNGAAFSVLPQPSTAAASSTQLYFFGGLKDAFANDDSLGKAQNAGLTNGPKINDQVTVVR